MSLSHVLLSIWLVLLGLAWASVITISSVFLGWWALVTGVVFLVEGYRPITVFKRP